MKWFLVVYFWVAGEWTSAEQLGHDGWYRVGHADVEACIRAQHEFTEWNQDPNKHASCELLEWTRSD